MLPSKKTSKSTSQSTGDNSIAINARGDVSVNTGLSISHVKEICRDMIKDDLKNFQKEAVEEAQRRGEVIVDEFTKKAETRFGKLVEQRLSEFKKPDAYLALRQTQQNYCRYGEEETKKVSVDLLLERISSNKTNFEKLKIDRAIQVSGNLTSQQISLLGFIYLVGEVIMDQKEPDKLKNHYFPTVTSLWQKSNIPTEEIIFMETTGALANLAGGRKWRSFDELHLRKYPSLIDEPKSTILPKALAHYEDISSFWDETIKFHALSPIGRQIAHIVLNHQTTLNIS